MAARLDSETIGDIFRSALLVLAFWGLLSGLWPAIGGMAGQFAGAAESVTVTKDLGVTTAPWDTLEAPSQSWIKVHVSSNMEVSVLIVALNSRTIRVANVSGFAAADDFLAVAKAQGTDVTLGGGHGGPVVYRISVHVGPNAKASGATDANVTYTMTWEVQKMDPMVIVGGLVLFSMFFVTEYMLHMRRDIRALARKVDKVSSEGGVRAPLASLGAPPVVESPPEAPAEHERGGFFGRRSRAEAGAERAAPESDAAGGRPRYAEAAAPAAAPAPELYAPPAYNPAPAYATSSYAPAPPAPAYAPPPSYSPPPSYTPPPAYAAPEPAPAYEAPPAPSARAAAAPLAPPPAPPAPAEGQEPVSKVRCPQCKHIVPVFTMERPTPIRCPNCGKRGMLTK
jgi:hypothetical protein